MPSMWTMGRREPRYDRLAQGVELRPAEQSTSLFDETDDDLPSDTSPFSERSSSNHGQTNSCLDTQFVDGSLTPCQLTRHDGRSTTVCLLVSSVFMLLCVSSLALALGGYSVFIFKPTPVIDKSVDAFSIPNHKASRGYHALNEAKYAQMYRHSPKRSLRSADVYAEQSQGSLSFEDSPVSSRRDKRSSKGNSPSDKFFIEHFADSEHSSDDGLSGALHRLVRRSLYRVCMDTQTCVRWKLQVIFMAIGEEEPANMFTPERLETVHRVEQQIINHPDYVNYCWKNTGGMGEAQVGNDRYKGCAPLNSLLTYFYPSVLPDGKVVYDGRGTNMANIKSSLDKAMSHKQFYYFVDENINSTYHKTKLLRTEVLFGTPLKGYHSSGDRKDSQEKAFKDFIVSYINTLSAASTSQVKVLYGGNEMFDYEVETTFWSDLWLARFALIFIGLFIFVLTSFSLWLTFWALLSIGLSFPIAIFLYRVAFNIQALGILNGAAAFVVIGIGVDDVFVFVNTFRQAEHMDKIKGRLLYTVKTAGKATFFTSFTTAAAFAANIASVIPALHEFGLFMALIVACCWLCVILLLPPVLYVWYIVFAWLEGLCVRSLKYVFYKLVLRKNVNTLHVYYKSGSDEILTESPGAERVPYLVNEQGEDDDVPMLQLEDQDLGVSDLRQNDEPLLVPYVGSTDPTFRSLTSSRQTQRKSKQLFDLGHMLQKGLCRFVTAPVIRGRWIVSGLYFVMLVVSVGLMTQIKMSSKPPQLFKDSTNLQMMLDLKANLSIDKFSCPTCSGFFQSDHQTDSTTSNPVPHLPPNAHIPDKWKNMSLPHGLFPPKNGNPFEGKITKVPLKSHSTKGSKPNHEMTTAMPRPTKTSPPHPRPTPPYHIPVTTAAPHPTMSIHAHERSTTVRPTRTTEALTTQSRQSVTHNRVSSLPKDFKVCDGASCGKAEERPVMESRAIVYVVFGIKDLDRSNLTSDHVINDNYGTVIYDKKFGKHFSIGRDPSKLSEDLRELCTVCKKIAANTRLVVNGSAQCLPTAMEQRFGHFLQQYKECANLPRDLRLYNQRAPGHAEARFTDDFSGIKWMAFAFESTTSKGQSYFNAYDEYLEWEKFISTVKESLRKDSPLDTMYQTSEFWTKVLMEVVCVSSAIYGVVLSVIICIIAVAVFTGHILLLLIVLLTIGGIICMVVALFFVAGWEMGAVEAVSLSILVGSSVDYCVHVVEGYLLAGESPQLAAIESSSKQRQWRVMQAVQHIGVSIVSSAVTTVAAAIPLTQTTIRPFSRFGDIVAMNTTFAIVYTLTACTAFLALFGPARFRGSWKASGISVLITLACVGVTLLTLFILSRAGVNIPSPNGNALFPK